MPCHSLQTFLCSARILREYKKHSSEIPPKRHPTSMVSGSNNDNTTTTTTTANQETTTNITSPGKRTTPISAANMANSSQTITHPRLSLLGLPAEIRNKIYLLAGTRVTVKIDIPNRRFPIEDSTSALLATCKQIRAEAALLCRHHRYFFIPARIDAMDWYRTLSPTQRSQVQEIWLETAATFIYGTTSTGEYGPIRPRIGPNHAASDLYHLRSNISTVFPFQPPYVKRALASIKGSDGHVEFCENPRERFHEINPDYRECRVCFQDVRDHECICWSCWSDEPSCTCPVEEEDEFWFGGQSVPVFAS